MKILLMYNVDETRQDMKLTATVLKRGHGGGRGRSGFNTGDGYYRMFLSTKTLHLVYFSALKLKIFVCNIRPKLKNILEVSNVG